MEMAMSYIRRESSDELDSCARELEELETVWFENRSRTVVQEILKSSEELGQRTSRGWTLFGALLIGERNT
jgi:hypothetical protein